MDVQPGSKLRNFHQAKWDEETIFELSTSGERGIHVPRVEPGISAAVGDGLSSIPERIRRKTSPALPEVGQMRVLKHFLRLSQQNLGADLNIDIGQGTCTVKYSPKINEEIAAHIDNNGDHLDKDQSGNHLCNEKLDRGEGCRLEALQEPILSVPNDDVPDAEEATEHHVHGKDAGKDPVNVPDLLALHDLLLKLSSPGTPQNALQNVAAGRA